MFAQEGIRDLFWDTALATGITSFLLGGDPVWSCALSRVASFPRCSRGGELGRKAEFRWWVSAEGRVCHIGSGAVGFWRGIFGAAFRIFCVGGSGAGWGTVRVDWSARVNGMASGGKGPRV